MGYIKFNHLNGSTFQNFIPEVTIKRNNEIAGRLIILFGVIFILGYYYQVQGFKHIQTKRKE